MQKGKFWVRKFLTVTWVGSIKLPLLQMEKQTQRGWIDWELPQLTRQSRDSTETCLVCAHPMSPLHCGRQSCSSSDHLKICNLTHCHPDPMLWLSQLLGHLRSPFTPPEKLRLCQWLLQSRAEFLNFDCLSLSQSKMRESQIKSWSQTGQNSY